MQTHTTYCRICEALCGLEVDVEGDQVRAIRPDPEHPVSRGYGCIKGMRFDRVHHDPDRLRHPMRRGPKGWERISWEAANDEIGARLRAIREAHGRHSVGLYFGNPSAFSYVNALAMQGFLRGLGTRNVWSAGSQDCNDKFVVGEAMFGSSLLQPIPDFARMRFLLLLGTNPAVSQMSFVHAPRPMERIGGIVARGGRVVVLDPRRTETAHTRGLEHRFIRPDTDVYLLAAIARRIVEGGAYDRARVRDHARGFSAFADAIRRFPDDLATRLTGLDAPFLDELATALSGERAAIHLSTGVNQGTAGAVAYYLAQCIHFLTGNLDRAGGVVVGRHLVDLPRIANLVGLDRTGEPSRIGGFRPVMGTLPATVMADEILTPGEGQVRALVVTAGNPALSCSNSGRMQQALSQLELLVTIDLYRNETGELGHFALPALDFLEREDFPLAFLTFQPEPYLQFTDAVVAPIGESRSEWEIFADLADAAGLSYFGVPFASKLFRAARRLGANDPLSPRRSLDAILRVAGTSIDALRRRPHGVLRDLELAGSFLGRRVLTRDGRVDLAPEALAAGASALRSKGEAHLAALEEDDRLLLFSKREKTSHNSWMHNVDDLVRGRRRTNYAYLHPTDAARRGISDGARVRVSSNVGSIELPAKLDPDVVLGGVAIPHGWGHGRAVSLRVASATEGVDVNVLAADGIAATEPLAGMTQLTGIPVRVELLDVASA